MFVVCCCCFSFSCVGSVVVPVLFCATCFPLELVVLFVLFVSYLCVRIVFLSFKCFVFCL